jgi:hypothetical protein
MATSCQIMASPSSPAAPVASRRVRARCLARRYAAAHRLAEPIVLLSFREIDREVAKQ